MSRYITAALVTLFSLVLASCGGGGGGGSTTYTVTATAGAGGSISPASATVNSGATANFTVTSNSGNSINTVTGCGGALIGTMYTTGSVTADCTVTASFVSNGLPTVSIANASVSEGDSGTTSLNFTVTLSAPSSSSVSVDYASSDNSPAAGSATAGSDYTATSGTLTIPAGNNSGTVTVNVTGDTTVESNETLTLTLSNPTGATLGTATATGTISNDDSASVLPTVSIADASVSEGDSGATSLVFTVTLSALANGNVNVDFATSDNSPAAGSATAGSDYTAATGTVTILAGSLSGTITVSVFGDTDVEANETLVLALSNPVGAVLGTATATGRINNDDTGTLVSTIYVNSATVTEGNAGTSVLSFWVGLSRRVSSDVTVNYATSDGTATAGSDYTAASGIVTIPAGSNSATITVDVSGDTILEGDEIVALTLSNPSGANLGTSLVTGVIKNDDRGEASPPIISIGSVTGILESGSSNGITYLSFGVGLSAAVSNDVTVNYATSDGTATVGSDYTGTSGTLTIPAGSRGGEIIVNVLDDAVVESDETFSLALSNPVGASLRAGSTIMTGVIRNDDSPGVRTLPSINVASTSALEGDVGPRCLRFTAKLSLGDTFATASSAVTVDYVTSDGSATAGSDFDASTGTMTIPVGALASTVCVNILGDTDIEGDETLTLTLSNPSSNVFLGVVSATGIILGDDGPVTSKLNDTGATVCSDGENNDLVCSVAGFPGQDAEFGRDFTHNDDGDGHAGYSFTKLDSNGSPLVDQGGDYSTTPWDCVRDNVTGLMWEVKTDDGGLRDRDWSYSWYNSTGINDGGSVGSANGGTCVDSDNCDTEKYVAAVNAVGLCGQNDWRLPTVQELLSLKDDSMRLSIDRGYFPNIQELTVDQWSSSPVADSPGSVWEIDFGYNLMWSTSAGTRNAVRLVRGGP